MDKWQPGASLNTLRHRAAMLSSVREFFKQRSVLEVDVPVMGKATVTDLNIDSITTSVVGEQGYLQTSPEYFMKRLLASGTGDIYFMGKAFRDGEVGLRHNPEFTMLEWYRCGWDDHQLMSEVAELISLLLAEEGGFSWDVTKISYSDCFFDNLGLDPHSAELRTLQLLAAKLSSQSWIDETRANCLDLIFSSQVEPHLPRGITIIYDYPECQAALAQISSNNVGQNVSKRFEAFVNGVEIANGYLELTDACEQRERFKHDRKARELLSKTVVPVDQKFLNALNSGIPACAGVAVGLDRLLMGALGVNSIDQVLTFSWLRC